MKKKTEEVNRRCPQCYHYIKDHGLHGCLLKVQKWDFNKYQFCACDLKVAELKLWLKKKISLKKLYEK